MIKPECEATIVDVLPSEKTRSTRRSTAASAGVEAVATGRVSPKAVSDEFTEHIDDSSTTSTITSENSDAHKKRGRRKSYDAVAGVWKTNGGYISTVYIGRKRIYGPLRETPEAAGHDRLLMIEAKNSFVTNENEMRQYLQQLRGTDDTLRDKRRRKILYPYSVVEYVEGDNSIIAESVVPVISKVSVGTQTDEEDPSVSYTYLEEV